MAEAPHEARADAVEREADANAAVGDESEMVALEEVWVEATLLKPPVQNAQKMARAPIDERAKDSKPELQTAGQGLSIGGPKAVQLRQAPRSELPAEQRQMSAMADRGAVPVRISMAGDSLLIEVFPPRPYPEAEMQKALILRPNVDSVVVMVGHHLLGLRIPRTFLAR